MSDQTAAQSHGAPRWAVYSLPPAPLPRGDRPEAVYGLPRCLPEGTCQFCSGKGELPRVRAQCPNCEGARWART